MVYSFDENYDRAIADYSKAIQINPQYRDAYQFRAEAYRTTGKNDLADADMRETFALGAREYDESETVDAGTNRQKLSDDIIKNPKDSFAYYTRGLMYYSEYSYDKAAPDFSKAIEIDPKLADAYFYRGMIYYFDENYDKAIADFSRVIQIYHQYKDAYQFRAKVYRAIGKNTLAAVDEKHAQELGNK